MPHFGHTEMTVVGGDMTSGDVVGPDRTDFGHELFKQQKTATLNALKAPIDPHLQFEPNERSREFLLRSGSFQK